MSHRNADVVPSRRSTRVVNRATLWLPLLTLLVYAVTATWRIPEYGLFIDVYGAALEGWQWAQNGVPWLDGVARSALVATGEPFPNWLFLDTGQHAVSSRTVGVVAASVPFALFGGSEFVLWPSTLAAVLLATAAVAMMHRALLHVVAPSIALAASLVLAFATPTWSVSADSLVTHPLTQASIAAAAWAAASSRWWLVGAAFAFGITGRAHIAAIAAVVGLGVGWARRDARVVVAVGIPAAVGLGVVVLTNAWRYGEPSVAGGYDYVAPALTSSDTPALAAYVRNWAGFLISADRGLVVWTPVVAALLLPAIRAARSRVDWTVWLALGGLAYSLIQMKINYFTGGDGFYSYRLGLELMTCSVPLLARGWNSVRTNWARVAVVSLCWLQFALIAPGAVVDGLHVPAQNVWTVSAFLLAIVNAPGVAALSLLIAMGGTWFTLRHLELIGRRPLKPQRAGPADHASG